jgi:hypothetical protein
MQLALAWLYLEHLASSSPALTQDGVKAAAANRHSDCLLARAQICCAEALEAAIRDKSIAVTEANELILPILLKALESKEKAQEVRQHRWCPYPHSRLGPGLGVM